MRAAFVEHGSSPWLWMVSCVSGVPIRELYALFPKAPATLITKIAGVPTRRACHVRPGQVSLAQRRPSQSLPAVATLTMSSTTARITAIEPAVE